jgi:hypothetical protein
MHFEKITNHDGLFLSPKICVEARAGFLAFLERLAVEKLPKVVIRDILDQA